MSHKFFSSFIYFPNVCSTDKTKKKTTTLNPKGAHAITIKAVLHNRERYRARAKGA